MVHGSVSRQFLVPVRFLRVVMDVGRGQPSKGCVDCGFVAVRMDAMRPTLLCEYDRIQFLPSPQQFLIKFLLHSLHLQAQHVHLLVLPPLVLQQTIEAVDLLPQQQVLLRAGVALGAGER